MSDNPIKSQIQGHSSGNTEIWDVTLTHADGRVAFAKGFASSADARRAEEFLRCGFANNWEIVPRCEPAILDAGVEALKADRFIEEGDDPDRAVASDLWDAMKDEWTRLTMARIERGEEPDEA